MKKMIIFITVTVLLLFSGCNFGNSDRGAVNEESETSENDAAQLEKQLLIQQKNELIETYDATLFREVIDACDYSVEIVDSYSDSNICLEKAGVIDIFYEEKEKYVLLDYLYSNIYTFKLKIDDEQYERIKALNDGEFNSYYNMCVCFVLDNVVSNQASTFSSFEFYINYDDVDIDGENEVRFDSRVIEGTLLDIIET